MDARRTGTSQPAAAPSRRLTIVPIAPERPSFFSSLFSTTKQQFKKLRTMCFPCIPVSNVELEELPAARSAEDRRRSGRASWIMAYDPVTRTNVRVGTCYDPVIQPVGYVAPAAGPVYGADDYISPYGPKIPDPVYHPVHNPAWFHAHTGFWPPYNEHFGHTPSEIIQQQLATAEAQGKGKQEMKPADDDPHRWYWVRELDDTWTQRNRLTIDSDGFGEVIWYVNKGEFYAVRKRKN